MTSKPNPEGLIVIHPTEKHQGTVILSHGMGQTNKEWEETLRNTVISRFPSFKWVLPQAPHRPVSWNQGALRPSWFNIWNLPPLPEEYDEEAINHSISTIRDLIREEVSSGVDSKRVFLMGFSQGAALSLCAGLNAPWNIGGIISLSGWLPVAHRKYIDHVNSLPILWCHGTADEEIPLSYGRDAEAFIETVYSNGSNSVRRQFTFKTYDGLEHNTNEAELEDVAMFLEERLQM
ncbi:hypothetical protein NMY22_g2135 [Coprinellus aureogranulatus]|nr:hypothetical protein NMY22_g2135 [Coprinellus aureogranulatus]